MTLDWVSSTPLLLLSSFSNIRLPQGVVTTISSLGEVVLYVGLMRRRPPTGTNGSDLCPMLGGNFVCSRISSESAEDA
ncbi:hypothetical protein BDZ94DRAFT_1271674 [Collybia nuda]|uniref:Uncharacterized protein n=1 Tax=Collybia nuda TaxID=64659 RepID=A0A9P6CA92_9AGAR|nr:hypothetical protein BDZ94DRAFT_1271674 [Collybia nuda]